MIEWKKYKLADLITIKHGFAFKGEFITDEETPNLLLTPGNFAIGGGFQVKKMKFYSGQIPKDYILSQGDLIVTMTDLSKEADTLGYSAVVPKASHVMLHNQRLGKVAVKSSYTTLDFVHWVLRTSDYRHEILSNYSGSTVKHTSPSKILAFEFSLPPLDEQRKIADVLGALDDKIELNRRMAATLEEMAQALYRSWFVDFDPVKAKAEGLAPAFMDEATAALFPDRFGDDGLPEAWGMGCVTDVFDVVMGQSPPGNTYNDRGEGLPFYQGRTDFGFRFPSQRVFCSAPKRIAPRDSVLLSVRAPVGDLNRAWEECCIGRGVASLSEKEGRNAYGYEALWALSEDLKAYDSEGTVFGAINKNQLSGLSLVVPPKSTRAAFEERVRSMDDRIRNVTAETRTLTALRDSLLPKLMSGELRVGEARDQIEEVA